MNNPIAELFVHKCDIPHPSLVKSVQILFDNNIWLVGKLATDNEYEGYYRYNLPKDMPNPCISTAYKSDYATVVMTLATVLNRGKTPSKTQLENYKKLIYEKCSINIILFDN